MIPASEAFAGTTLGCSFTIPFAGTSCRERSDINPAASAKHAASAATLTRRTSLRRA
jgi:hypothetical protein